jgi:tellurite resistance protein TerC
VFVYLVFERGGPLTTFPLWAWAGFIVLLVLRLVLDLSVLARGAKVISFRRATILSGFWVGVAVLFGLALLVFAGPERGGEYFAGYIVEKSLSVDNVFVFALIFSYFAVPPSTSTGCSSGAWSARSSCEASSSS